MKHLNTIAAAIIAMGFTGATVGASLTDEYDPYVTYQEIEAVPSTPTEAELRMADFYDPYILADEIVVKESCANPAMDLIADTHGNFFTLAELKTAEMKREC